jgi:hypothetical protein
VTLQVAFLTGQSDRVGAALSPLQARFLDALPIADESKVRVNFPYPASTRPHRDVPLVAASWNNVTQTIGSRRSAFRERHRAAALDLLERADHTLFLAGSCGLELLANLELGEAALARAHVFAYGPVVWRQPACELRVVQGEGDWISRLLSPHALRRIARRVDCGHLGYLADREVAALCRSYLLELSGELSGR